MIGEIAVNKVVEQTAKELAEAKEYAGKVYSIADKIKESHKLNGSDLESILVYTAKIFTIINDWETYYNKFNKILTEEAEAVNKQIAILEQEKTALENEVNDLKINSGKLLIDNEKLQNNNAKLLEEAETSNKQIGILEQEKAVLEEQLEAADKQVVTLEAEITRLREEQENKVENIVNSLSDVLSLIDKNAKTIANFEGNRERQKKAKGKDSNRFIQELDTEELIKVYKENNYSLPKEVVAYYNRKYNITYHGLRERLIQAKEWKGRR